MPLTPVVQQSIDQIIAATPDVTTELKLSLQDELEEQFDALLIQIIIEQLPKDKVSDFENLLSVEPVPNHDAIRKLIDAHFTDYDSLINQAIERMNQQYID